MKRVLSMVAVAGLLAAGGAGFLLGSAAQAVPEPQEACAFDQVTTTADAGSRPIPGLQVSVTNSALGVRKAIVQLSADTGVDPGAEVRVAYSVDGGPPQEGVFGPANLANHQEFFEARTVIAVIPLPRGGHTITAHWRVSGVSGKRATIDNRCMTVELRSE